MSLISVRLFAVLVSMLIYAANSEASPTGADGEICGIRLAAPFSVASGKYAAKYVGPEQFRSLARSEMIVLSRFELTFRRACGFLRKHEHGVPDIVVETTEKDGGDIRIISFQPATPDCGQWIGFLASVLGPPASRNSSEGEWTLAVSNTRVYLHAGEESECWVTITKL